MTNKINEYIINVNNIYIGGVSYMNEWWDGLSLLLKVLYCIAFPSTLILLVQTLLSMFGFHDGGSGHDFSDTMLIPTSAVTEMWILVTVHMISAVTTT